MSMLQNYIYIYIYITCNEKHMISRHLPFGRVNVIDQGSLFVWDFSENNACF